MSKYKLARLVEDRDSAFTHAVMTDDFKPVLSYCKRYGVPTPKDKRVMQAGVYKAVQECISIPEEVKAAAREKCLALGFSPFMWGD